MKKKLLDRRGVAIELAILMIVICFALSVLVMSTSLLQHEKKLRMENRLKQSIALEQLGQDFLSAVSKGNIESWTPEMYGDSSVTIDPDHSVGHIFTDGICACGERAPARSSTEAKRTLPTAYRLLMYKTGAHSYRIKIEMQSTDDESIGETPCIPQDVLLRIVLTLDEENEVYTITEWTKNDGS